MNKEPKETFKQEIHTISTCKRTKFRGQKMVVVKTESHKVDGKQKYSSYTKFVKVQNNMKELKGMIEKLSTLSKVLICINVFVGLLHVLFGSFFIGLFNLLVGYIVLEINLNATEDVDRNKFWSIVWTSVKDCGSSVKGWIYK